MFLICLMTGDFERLDLRGSLWLRTILLNGSTLEREFVVLKGEAYARRETWFKTYSGLSKLVRSSHIKLQENFVATTNIHDD